MVSPFFEGFIFTKLHIHEVSQKQTLTKISEFTVVFEVQGQKPRDGPLILCLLLLGILLHWRQIWVGSGPFSLSRFSFPSLSLVKLHWVSSLIPVLRYISHHVRFLHLITDRRLEMLVFRLTSKFIKVTFYLLSLKLYKNF